MKNVQASLKRILEAREDALFIAELDAINNANPMSEAAYTSLIQKIQNLQFHSSVSSGVPWNASLKNCNEA